MRQRAGQHRRVVIERPRPLCRPFQARIDGGSCRGAWPLLDAALTAAGSRTLKERASAAEVSRLTRPRPATTAPRADGCGNPRLYRSDHARLYGGGAALIWYVAAGNRTKLSISGFGDPGRLAGSWSSTTRCYLATRLAGRSGRQCLAHYTGTSTTPAAIARIPVCTRGRRRAAALLRRLTSRWPARTAPLPCPAGPGCAAATTRPVSAGISITCPADGTRASSRPRPRQAAQAQAAQVWLFVQPLRRPLDRKRIRERRPGYNLAAKNHSCWRTLSTLPRHCRIRSYLTTARSTLPATPCRHPLAFTRQRLMHHHIRSTASTVTGYLGPRLVHIRCKCAEPV